MTYTFGKDHIVKHKYNVYMRNYPITADIASKYYTPRITDLLDATVGKQENLYRLAAACCNDSGLAGQETLTDAVPTFVNENYWYKLDASNNNIAITLAADNPSGAGKAAGDIVVFETISIDGHTVTVTDQNAKEINVGNIGDIAVFRYTDKWIFWFFAAEGSVSLGPGAITTIVAAPTAGGTGYTVDDILTVSEGTGGTVKVTGETGGVVDTVELVTGGTGYTTGAGKATTGGNNDCTIEIASVLAGSLLYYYDKIGILDAGPFVKTSEGDTRATNEGTDLVISENIEVNATVLEVTKDNWEWLRTWTDNEMDVIFYDTGNVQDGISAEYMIMTAHLEATGGDINTVLLMLKGEAANVDNLFAFTYVGT